MHEEGSDGEAPHWRGEGEVKAKFIYISFIFVLGGNMPEIRFINVKHGDFGIFEDLLEEYLCVWDCGTSQEKDYLKVGFPNMTPVDMIASEVRRILKYHENWTKDVLISHYHFDHYNGLEIFKRHGITFRNMLCPIYRFLRVLHFNFSLCTGFAGCNSPISWCASQVI